MVAFDFSFSAYSAASDSAYASIRRRASSVHPRGTSIVARAVQDFLVDRLTLDRFENAGADRATGPSHSRSGCGRQQR